MRTLALCAVVNGLAAPARAQAPATTEDVDILAEDIDAVRARAEAAQRAASRFRGWVDVGFFAAGGDGSGIRRDVGHVHFPEFDGLVPGSWVFMGDPLSTAVNARGEPADTGPSRAVQLDSLDAGGTPTFAVNTLSLALAAAVGPEDRVTVTGLVDLVPRERDAADAGSTGSFVDVKLAFVEAWMPTAFPLAVYAGKVYSVVGVEYRTQEAPERLTVTPSLVCRYTCGYPTGVGARALWFDRALSANVAVTNGTHFVPGFSFSDEIDDNQWKTATARASWTFPVGVGLELGASGSIGPQDEQPDDGVLQWQYGLDARLDLDDVVVQGEFVQGDAEGEDAADAAMAPCAMAPCLEYKAAYGLVGWRAANWLTPFARVDWRDALHRFGPEFVYVSELWRATGGVRVEVGANVVAKAEYTWNRELGRIPQFPNDVFASSLVVEY